MESFMIGILKGRTKSRYMLMKPADRQKMCPNCDGRVAYDATQCPYCFATLQVEGAVQGSLFKHQTLQDSLTNLYAPPYGARPAEPTEEKKMSPKTPEPTVAAASMEKEEASDNKNFWPILFLSLAGNLFTLGVLQFFFSEQGLVKLEVNGSYWFLFILLSFPLFYFGFKQAKE